MKTTTHLGTLAAAILASYACRGADVGGFATVTGVVSSVMQYETEPKQNWFTLRTPSGGVLVSVANDKFPLDRLLALTDVEVEVRGPVEANDRLLGFSGQHLSPEGKEGIRTTKPAPDAAPEFAGDPHDAKSFTRREAEGAYLHRVRLEGMLVTETDLAVFMEIADGSIVKLVMQENAKRPRCGTMATATGFASFDCGGLQMHDVVLSPAHEAKAPPPPEVWDTTLDGAHRRARYDDGFRRRIVSFSGYTSTAPGIIHASKYLWVRSDGNFVAVDISRYGKAKPYDYLVGTNIRVTGVCEPVFAPDTGKSPVTRFRGITIVPLPEDGVVILDRTKESNELRRMSLTLRRVLFVSIHLLILATVVTVTLVIQRILYNRRGRQLLNEQVAHVRTKAKIDERTRLATELHDAVSQTLTGVALQIDSAEMANKSGKQDAVARFLATSRLTLAACRRELKDCLWDLRSRTFEEKDMTEAVNRTIAPHVGDAQATVRFNVQRSRLSEPKAHSVLSMVRELVVNAVRHGKARRIWIAGECSDGHISFSVRDDGCGFDPSSTPGPREGHFGLQGVRERVLEANGKIEISSAPGRGTKVTVTIAEVE